MPVLSLPSSMFLRIVASVMLLLGLLPNTSDRLQLHISLPHTGGSMSQPLASGVTPAALDAADWNDIQTLITAYPHHALIQNDGYASAMGDSVVLTVDDAAQQAYLKASNIDTNGFFGHSVAVSGDTVVVGAFGEASNATGVNGNQADNTAPDSGAAYVFVRSGSTWTQQAYLKASNTDTGDEFGRSVAVSGDTVVVGAGGEDSNATGVDGDQADNTASGSGAAYVFVRSGSTWTQQAYLKASNTDTGDTFGSSVAVAGDTVVVGADSEDSNATGVDGDQDDNTASLSGAAYVFVRSGSTWSQQAYLKASNTDAFDFFGRSVTVAGDTVVVGAFGESSNATGVNGNQSDNSDSQSGAAYVFVRSDNTWSQQAYLKASNTNAFDEFGSSLAVAGDTVVVGAFGEDSNATGVDGNQTDNTASGSGAAYVFARNGGIWTQQAYLKASNTGAGDIFGSSVALSGNVVVVGANGEDSNATGADGNQSDNSYSQSGAAYVFVRGDSTWSQQAYLKASNTGAFDKFGTSIAVAGDTVVAGADGEDSNAADSGAAYMFIIPIAPTITSVAPPNGSYGTSYSFTVTASGTASISFSASGLPPGLTIDPSSGIISGTPTQVGRFTTTITASNDIAPAASQTITVEIMQASQTITFATLTDKKLGDVPFGVSATASSDLPVTFSSSTPSVCTVSGSTVTLVAAGTCTITASQAGDADYQAAEPVNQSFVVAPAISSKQAQTITFAALPNKTLGEAPFALSATASSGLPVSYNSSTPSVCTVSGGTVTLVAAGTCTITASQAGDTNYEAAAPISQSFMVAALTSQTLTHLYLPLVMRVYSRQ